MDVNNGFINKREDNVIYSFDDIRSIEEAEYEYDIEMEYGGRIFVQVKETDVDDNTM
jgi:hypothetical protein